MVKTLVCVDMSNLHYYLTKKGWRINWEKFKSHICRLYGDVVFIFYDGFMCRQHFMALNPGVSELQYYLSVKKKQSFFKYLKRMGYRVECKPTVQTCDIDTGELKRKCNFDVEITMDALTKINEYNRFVLCSADRDFLKLIKYLKNQHKETVLIYPKDRTSKEIIKCVNRRFTLGSMKYIIGEVLPNKIGSTVADPDHLDFSRL